jgi:hypothetical protein
MRVAQGARRSSRVQRSSSACRSRCCSSFRSDRVSQRGATGSSPLANGMVASLLRLAGLDWPVPDSSTLCRRQKTLKVQIPCRRAGGRLNLLVDSTGIKVLGDGEWQARSMAFRGDAHGARSIWPWTRHLRHPPRRVHPQPGRRQPRPAGPGHEGSPPRSVPDLAHRHGQGVSCLLSP